MKKLNFDFQHVIIFFALFISLLFTYSYIDFSSNMSVGAGHVYTAKSLALSRNFNVDEYWGNSGVDVIDANSTLVTAQKSLSNSTFDLQLAIIDLKRSMGVVLEEVIIGK